jgi:hypothetical protein
MLGAQVAVAHHSIVEFDYTKSYAVTGIVKELQWTNPHAWVQVLVHNEDGGVDEWGFELGAPLFNVRMGWRKDSVVAGQEVTVVFCPSKAAKPRGTLLAIRLPSGERLNGVAPSVYSGPPYDDFDAVARPPPLAHD